MSLFPADEHKGGTVAKADQLVPEVEEALLQTEGPNAVLRQGCQGEVQMLNARRTNLISPNRTKDFL